MSWRAVAPVPALQCWRASLAVNIAYGPRSGVRALQLHVARHHDEARCNPGLSSSENDKMPSLQCGASPGRSEARATSDGDTTNRGASTGAKRPQHVGRAIETWGESTGNPSTVGETSKSPVAYWGFSPIPFIARGRSMPGQRLLPCTKEDAAILAKAQSKYPSPQEVEGAIIVRIIAAKDVHRVTSPVLRVVRNRQYGIRKGERLRLALGGALFSAILGALGFWQLRRMEEKKQLIEYRRGHLARQPTLIVSSPFPWTLDVAANSEERKRQECAALNPSSATGEPRSEVTFPGSKVETVSFTQNASNQQSDLQQKVDSDADNASPLEDITKSPEVRRQPSGSILAAASPDDVERAVGAWAYNPVVVHGVLDSSTELLVGPRPGLDVGTPGFCVVSPLRLHDGSVILVNKGHLPMKLAKLPPFPKAVDEENDLIALMQQQRQQLAHQQSIAAQQPNIQVDHLQQQHPRPNYVDSGTQQRLEQLQTLAGSRTEPIGSVTVRGVLEPGEICNSSFKPLMLKNRPQDGQFIVLNPKDLAEATPGIQNRAEAGLLMVNAYSIVYDDDIQSTSSGKEGSVSRVPNRFMSYQQKQKADYMLFYADEHTHFNYACQWFLMGLCTAAMTIYKVVEVTRWRW